VTSGPRPAYFAQDEFVRSRIGRAQGRIKRVINPFSFRGNPNSLGAIGFNDFGPIACIGTNSARFWAR